MIAAAIMATMFSVSVGFSQTAEAGIFDSIGKGIGDVFGKGKGGDGGGSIEDTVKDTAKSTMKQDAKEALAKALNADIDKISDKKASMMKKFVKRRRLLPAVLYLRFGGFQLGQRKPSKNANCVE